MPFTLDIASLLLPFLGGFTSGGSVPTKGVAEMGGVSSPIYDVPAASQPFNWTQALRQGASEALMGGLMGLPGWTMSKAMQGGLGGFGTPQTGQPRRTSTPWLALLLSNLFRR